MVTVLQEGLEACLGRLTLSEGMGRNSLRLPTCKMSSGQMLLLSLLILPVGDISKGVVRDSVFALEHSAMSLLVDPLNPVDLSRRYGG
ncbi:hypothetical protein NPIL_405411 [Nephila pilipes]|uniref:Uncharacterized protein n=1 Tax=Nephila pilipes TaxID=299642 RepID=A0A8X6U0E4_NEPPI|nr:hypothetical protein NPIL_405411 [Nephila pilipes]